MQPILEILPYSEELRNQILEVWEKSVLATHDFLHPADFVEIKALVQTIPFQDFQVYCLNDREIVIGFIGVAEQKIEMLFLDPEYFGKGYGKKLLDFALTELKANAVDVNVQNEKACLFYQHHGFEIVEKTEKDDQGRNYPLFRMQLKKL